MSTRILDAVLAILCAGAICAMGFSWGHYSQAKPVDVALHDETGQLCNGLDDVFKPRSQGAKCIVTGYLIPHRNRGWSIASVDGEGRKRLRVAEAAIARTEPTGARP